MMIMTLAYIDNDTQIEKKVCPLSLGALRSKRSTGLLAEDSAMLEFSDLAFHDRGVDFLISWGKRIEIKVARWIHGEISEAGGLFCRI